MGSFLASSASIWSLKGGGRGFEFFENVNKNKCASPSKSL
jgi:hypothetical protein